MTLLELGPVRTVPDHPELSFGKHGAEADEGIDHVMRPLALHEPSEEHDRGRRLLRHVGHLDRRSTDRQRMRTQDAVGLERFRR